MSNKTLGPFIVAKEFQRFRHPEISSYLKDAVLTQLDSAISIYDNGGVYGDLENAFRDMLGGGFVLTVNSGTSAILSMYHSLGLPRGTEVIVSVYNFFASATPLAILGLVPVFADCTENGNLCPVSAASKVGPRTGAIAVTHIWGVPAEMADIVELGRRNKLAIVEDASHAHGALYDGKVVGTFGDAAAWSLQGKKIISAGEGGVFATGDATKFQRAVLLGHFNRRAKCEVTDPHLRRFSTTGTGLNLRMHPLAAALALAQMKSFKQQLSERREVSAFLYREVSSIPGLVPVPVSDRANPAWYAFPILFKGEEMYGLSKDQFVRSVQETGAVEIDSPDSTRPLTDYDFFSVADEAAPGYPPSVKCLPSDYPNAYRYSREVFKLPVWYGPKRLEYAREYVNAMRHVLGCTPK